MAFGLPRLPGISGGAISTGVIGAIQSAIWNYLADPLTWGIYNNGIDTLAIEVDSVIRASQSSTSDVPSYPVIAGTFSNYNKINKPDEYRLTISKSGNPDARRSFLDWLQENKENASLFDIVTPETTYESVTLADFSISRDVREGTVTMIIAECTFRQVRQSPAVYYNAAEGKADTTDAQNPEDTPTSQGKFVNPIEYVASGVNSAVEYVGDTITTLQGEVNEIINGIIGGGDSASSDVALSDEADLAEEAEIGFSDIA